MNAALPPTVEIASLTGLEGDDALWYKDAVV